MDHLQLTWDKLSVDAISDLVIDDSCGAVSIFVGTTRDNFEGKKVIRLEYESYEPMALKALKSICDQMREKWPKVHGIAIYHRLGDVPTREASVVIAVSSPHRRDSLEAVAHCIERLKATVPIWKKEIYEEGGGGGEELGGRSMWKQNEECDAKAEIVPKPTIDKSLIQINVSRDVLLKRIDNFISRKREQVNMSNIHDFIESTPGAPPGGGGGDGGSCARVRTLFVKRSDSKGHLKVHRVNNEWGPQTVRPAVGAERRPSDASLPPAIEERVRDVESFLNMRPVAGDVYRRLKEMEDRIRHLESVSPEYAHFWRKSSSVDYAEDFKSSPGRKTEPEFLFSADEISRKIEELENEGFK